MNDEHFDLRIIFKEKAVKVQCHKFKVAEFPQIYTACVIDNKEYAFTFWENGNHTGAPISAPFRHNSFEDNLATKIGKAIMKYKYNRK